MKKPLKKAVLFDLDGTLLDTAPDLVFALNILRKEQNLPPLTVEQFKPFLSFGSKTLVQYGQETQLSESDLFTFCQRFFTFYENHIADATVFFPGMDTVLDYLDQNGIPWGIVTNKLTRHTEALLKALAFDHRPHCIVCADTLPKSKPNPEPIWHACEALKINSKDCVYVGDTETDVIAGKAAGTQTLVALYGYINSQDDAKRWRADGYIQRPVEIIDWVGGV